uniref:HECT domain-containing protein n=1 Tax=Amphiprion percula TaxID=161767 RepID=A0A3P8SBH1_AMPPE
HTFASMGRQTVSLPDDSDHVEVQYGRRKLTVIPPEAEGYSVKTLRAQSGGGKATFYIQETLDTSPLPPGSQHFSKMPKKTCYQCNEVMPLQMLAIHIKTCRGKSLSDETDEEVRENSFCFIMMEMTKHTMICPICNKDFPQQEIAVHFLFFYMEDVLRFLEQQVDTTTEFKLCVDREDLPDRGILQWQRKKTASPISALKVVYIGEAGVDTGALKKEFLTDMISGIENRFFEGPGSQGKNPKYSLTDLDNENFRTVGEIIAVTWPKVAQLLLFSEWCYRFLCTGEVDFSCLSKEDSLMLLADEVINCGYTSQIKLDNKENTIEEQKQLLIPILQQMRKGMELYGLVNQMATNPEACHALFQGRSSNAAAEESHSLGVQHVLQWLTGQSHIPILPDEKRHFKITCIFDHDCRERLGDHSICYPFVSSCTRTVIFPVQHLNTYTEFRRIMSEAVRYGGGLYRV